MMKKDWEHYKRKFKEQGIVLRFPEDCGCEECQITYLWIQDGCPGRAEEFAKINQILEELK